MIYDAPVSPRASTSIHQLDAWADSVLDRQTGFFGLIVLGLRVFIIAAYVVAREKLVAQATKPMEG